MRKLMVLVVLALILPAVLSAQTEDQDPEAEVVVSLQAIHSNENTPGSGSMYKMQLAKQESVFLRSLMWLDMSDPPKRFCKDFAKEKTPPIQELLEELEKDNGEVLDELLCYLYSTSLTNFAIQDGLDRFSRRKNPPPPCTVKPSPETQISP